MLSQELGKMKRVWIMMSVIAIAVGLLMIMCPLSYIGMLVSTLGYVLLVAATVVILEFCSSKKVLVNYIYLTGGLLVGLLGLFVLIQMLDMLPLLSLVFGLVLIVEGIYDFGTAYKYARRAGHAAWITLTILSVLTIAFGVILLINPWWDSTEVIKNVIGIMMLITSVFSIIRVVLLWPFRSV